MLGGRLLDSVHEAGETLRGQKSPSRLPMIRGEAILVLMALQKVPFYYSARPVISPS